MILAVGKVLFYGSLDTALPYFTHIGFPVPLFMNPADHFLDVSTMDTSTPFVGYFGILPVGSLDSPPLSPVLSLLLPRGDAGPDNAGGGGLLIPNFIGFPVP